MKTKTCPLRRSSGYSHVSSSSSGRTPPWETITGRMPIVKTRYKAFLFRMSTCKSSWISWNLFNQAPRIRTERRERIFCYRLSTYRMKEKTFCKKQWFSGRALRQSKLSLSKGRTSQNLWNDRTVSLDTLWTSSKQAVKTFQCMLLQWQWVSQVKPAQKDPCIRPLHLIYRSQNSNNNRGWLQRRHLQWGNIRHSHMSYNKKLPATKERPVMQVKHLSVGNVEGKVRLQPGTTGKNRLSLKTTHVWTNWSQTTVRKTSAVQRK